MFWGSSGHEFWVETLLNPLQLGMEEEFKRNEGIYWKAR